MTRKIMDTINVVNDKRRVCILILPESLVLEAYIQ